MPAPRPRRRARLSVLTIAALALGGAPLALATGSAEAAPGGTSLVISEVYGGGGNSGAPYKNDFIELYNPTDSDVVVDGWSVQGRSATNTSPATAGANITPLSGSVPAHGYYLVGEAAGAGNGVALPTTQASGTMGIAAGGWQIWLASTTVGLDPADGDVTANPNSAIVDLVGAATTSASYEKAAQDEAPSNTTSAARDAQNTDTDDNAGDFSVGAPTPTGSVAPQLAITDIGDKNALVGVATTPFTATASNASGEVTWDDDDTLPPGIDIDATSGEVSGTPSTAGTYPVVLTATDSAGSDTEDFTFTVASPPATQTPIAGIQGTGAASPVVGQVVSTQGVVTARYPSGGLNGFFIQTPGADTPDASDAIFVQGSGDYPELGASVDVIGTVSESFDLTRLTGASWTAHTPALGAVQYKTVIPGTDCPLPGDTCLSGAALDTAREVAEGEAFQPAASNPWTLTDVYDGRPYYGTGDTNGSSNFGELGVAAQSDQALVAPTELYDAQTEAAQVAARTRWNDAHRIILDDGSTTNYSSNSGQPLPWMTPSYVPRVGAAVTFPGAVVLYKDFDVWRVQPSTQVVGAPTDSQPQLEQTRAAEAAPAAVGGDVRLATFNVLNFFPTTGKEYVDAGLGVCEYYTDRQSNPITTRNCGNPQTSSGNGPRGAADEANLARQRAKIVSAITTADADIVSLEELENSAKFGKSRDFAIGQLVDALNEASAPGTWAFAPSPTGADLPALADEDVIRTGFIYQPAAVSLVGTSKILVGSPAFGNAREPLAQAFKETGAPDSSAFTVIVNHFKSKGSGVDDGTGQGNSNPDRVAQAQALVAFADQVKAERGTERVFLVGDFNAYSHEDPVQALEAAGYAAIDSTTDPGEETYNFDGQIGSLDHVFANAPAQASVTGADVWPINGYESVLYEYSRYNANVTDLYDDGPFRSSDHSPEIVGISTPTATTEATVKVPEQVSVTFGRNAAVRVRVSARGAVPTGTVSILSGETVVGTGTLTGGATTIEVPSTSFSAGAHPLVVRYAGDATVLPASATTTLVVRPDRSSVSVDAEPSRPVVGEQVTLTVRVKAAHGAPVTGRVRVVVKGGTVVTADVVDGVATVDLGRFTKPGVKRIEVRYLGSDTIDPSSKTLKLKVKQHRK